MPTFTLRTPFPILLLALATLACADVAQVTGVPAFDCANPPKDRLQVAPSQLVSAFGDNVISAEGVYGNDKLLEVTGQASRVSRDDDGAFVALRSGPIGKGKVQAYFPDANAAAFAKVEEGQTITVLAYLQKGRSTDKRIPLSSACLVNP